MIVQLASIACDIKQFNVIIVTSQAHIFDEILSLNRGEKIMQGIAPSAFLERRTITRIL